MCLPTSRLPRSILAARSEEPPSGDDWHARLIARCSAPVEHARPAVISSELRHALDETRQFRHVAMHVYEHFDRPKAEFAIAAAKIVLRRLKAEIRAFQDLIDPPGDA
jgi:hypothetical protein